MTRNTKRQTRQLCITPYCRNVTKKPKCHKCYKRAWRAANPMLAAFNTLRDHARSRGIEFTISFEEFERFAEGSGYIEQKSNTAKGMTVDRIDNLRGYVPGNIQAMTREENSVKRAKQDMIRMQQGYAWRGRA